MARQSDIDILLGGLDLKGKRVIDVGCGNGELVHRLVAAGATAIGIDPNPKRIAKARAGAPARATLREGRGESLPVDDGSVDVVVFFNSLHHVPVSAMDAALGEAARALKPGGVLYVSEPVAEGSYFEAMKPVTDETEVRAAALAALKRAVKAGAFREVSEHLARGTRVEESFEGACAQLIDTDPKRAPLIEAKKEELRSRFLKYGRKCEGGYAFDRSTRFNLLSRL